MQRGFSLIELMVAITIGLVLMLTVTTMITRQESVRRGVTSGNDLTSNSAYAAYTLDRELRSAGSGFSQDVAAHYGCPLAVSRDNTQLLPATKAFPAPFNTVPQTVALAPLIVHAGAGANGSDVIAVAVGNSGLGETVMQVAPNSAAADQISLTNTIGLRGGDLVLLSQPGQRCLLQQVRAGFVSGETPLLTFGGTYAANVVAGTSLLNFGTTGDARAVVLGNVAGNRPRMQLIGVDGNARLVSYDLLQTSGADVATLVEGVVDMRVRYGIDNTGATGATAVVNAWVAPTDANYTAAVLQTPANALRLQSILAVQVALVLRSDLAERDAVAPATLTLFANLPAALQHTYNVPAGTTNQRYRTVEFTVPLRNVRFSR